MLGCVTLPFRLLGLVIVLAAAAGLWLYRDKVMGVVAGVARGEMTVETLGVADESLRAGAMRKLAGLGGAGADSVVLSADEAATLLATAVGGRLQGEFGALELRLGQDLLRVRGTVRTGKLPSEVLGPAALVVREREPVEMAGPLVSVGAGRAEWRIRDLELRGVPLPTAAVQALLHRAVGDSTARGIPFPLPGGARDVRVSPAGLILYARPRA